MKEKFKFLNLQLFADDEELDIDDFEDDKSDDEKEKQNRKKNAEEARKRREREQKEAIEKATKEAYERGLQEGKRGALKINTFTGETIEDEIDVADFELMQRLKDEGKDPIKDFRSAKAKLVREQNSKLADDEKAKKEAEDNEKKDRADFIKEVGSKEKAIEIFKNPRFKVFSKGRIGNEPLKDIYKDFVEYEKVEGAEPYVPGVSGSGSGDDKPNTKKMSYTEHDAYMKQKYGG